MTHQDPAGETKASASAADGVESFGYRQQLKRSLSFTDLLVYGLIFMVPIAPFGIFGGVFQASGGMVALVYAVGMLPMAFTAASYAQMSRAFPIAGALSTPTLGGASRHRWGSSRAGWCCSTTSWCPGCST